MSETATRTARGTDDWVERVREASDIVEVIRATVSLKRVGRNWVGLCPFHKEKTPSFSVNAERQFYHCFSCKVGGDVFKYVQETEKVGFLEAVEFLSRRAGIPVPERGAPGERGLRTRLLQALDLAATAYQQWLGDPQQGAATRAYLERRGVTDVTRRQFRLGLSLPGWDHLVGKLRGQATEDDLIQAGLAARRDNGRGLYDRFRNRLMVPLVGAGGAVVGFGARALADDDPPKYLNSPETPVYHKSAFLFGLDAARRTAGTEEEMIVVEGYFDAIALHQAGIANTVATSGTALTPEQAAMLRRVVPRVVLTYDGDAAGREAMMRSLGVLLGEGLDVAIVDLPSGQDPDTLVRSGGTAAWSELRRAAADPVEFVQRHLLRQAQGSGASAGDPRERALHAVVELAGRIPDPIRRGLLFERAEQVLGLGAAVIERALDLKRAGHDPRRPVSAALQAARRDGSHAERQLLAAFLHSPDTLAPARDQLHLEDFGDPHCAALARWFWDGGTGMPVEGAEAELARELLADDRPLDWMEEARGAVRLLVQRRLRGELKERQQRLRHARDARESEQLLQDIGNIAQSLKDWSASI
jgi:DNA primase